jgi:hypothetical protein
MLASGLHKAHSHLRIIFTGGFFSNGVEFHASDPHWTAFPGDFISCGKDVDCRLRGSLACL